MREDLIFFYIIVQHKTCRDFIQYKLHILSSKAIIHNYLGQTPYGRGLSLILVSSDKYYSEHGLKRSPKLSF